ncbi:MAG: trigger factor [Oscillospiraceae bacterium]|nr:trigger factor [Oscillospiraceae bacterium]
MSVKSCEKLEKSMVELTIEVSAADFEAAVEKAYRKQRGQVRLPGFRPGKAPRKMIERMYGDGFFYEEAVNIVLPDAYAGAVKEQELEVVGYPKVELLEVGKNGMSFKAAVAVYPEVTLGQYKGLEAPKGEVNVTEEDINARLGEMAERNSRMVDQDRAVENGDIANIDFKGYLDGVPFEGGEGAGFDLGIGSGQFVPGFEEQLVGMAPGEEKDIDITFPENYHAELAGKAVVFHVKVNAVKVKELPALDDEFAKDVSEEFDTLAQLKEDVAKSLREEREAAANTAFENALMEKVAQGITAALPDAMIEEQTYAFMENFKRQLQSQGLTMEQYMQMANTDEEALLAQAREPAEQQVRMDLAIAAIIKAENIVVTEEDVEAELQRRANEFKMDVETLRKYLGEAMIREQLLRNKVVAVVAESAVPTKLEPQAAETPAEEQPVEKPKRKRTSKKAAAASAEAAEEAPKDAQ